MAHSVCFLIVHVVFSTKGREPAIGHEIEHELYAYMGTVLREFGSPPLIIGGDKDHVRLLLSLGRTRSVAQVVEEVKKRSSKWLKTKHPRLSTFQWQAGYAAFSVGESLVQLVKDYIAGQKEHHRRRSFKEEYLALLQEHNIEYDERYMWD